MSVVIGRALIKRGSLEGAIMFFTGAYITGENNGLHVWLELLCFFFKSETAGLLT